METEVSESKEPGMEATNEIGNVEVFNNFSTSPTTIGTTTVPPVLFVSSAAVEGVSNNRHLA